MSTFIGIVLGVIKILLGSGVDVEVKTDVELGKNNPTRRKRIVELIKLHYKNTSNSSSAVGPSDASSGRR